MGCNCGKGKEIKLNNMDSRDHLALASDVVKRIISQKTVEEMDDFDKQEIIGTYKQLYPRQTMEVNLNSAIANLVHAHNLYTQKRYK